MTTDTEPLEAVVSTDAQQPGRGTAADLIRLTTELAKINATDAHLATLLGEARLLADMGLPASPNEYENLHCFVMTAQKVRTGALKIGKEMAAPHKAVYDAIMGEAKRIGEKAKEAEDLTRPFKEQYERNLEQQKIDEQRARHQRVVERVASLMQLGMASIGGQYKGYEITIDGIEVEALPDEEWNELYGKVEAAHAEQKRKDEAFAEQLRLELEAEKKQKQDELKRQQDEADALKREREALLQEVFSARVSRLVALGWVIDAKRERVCYGPDCQHYNGYDFIRTATAEQFESSIEQVEQWKVEAKREAEVFEARAAALAAEGLTLDGPHFFYDNEACLSRWIVDSMTDEEFDAYVAALRQARTDEANAAKQAEADDKARKKADKERTQRLAPDKKRFSKWLKAFYLSLPEVKEAETIDLMAHFAVDVEEVVNRYIAKIDAL